MYGGMVRGDVHVAAQRVDNMQLVTALDTGFFESSG
jgi:hypothetical protein